MSQHILVPIETGDEWDIEKATSSNKTYISDGILGEMEILFASWIYYYVVVAWGDPTPSVLCDCYLNFVPETS